MLLDVKNILILKSKFTRKAIRQAFEQKWKGKGGKVDWRRNDVKDVFAELEDYEIDLKKNQYDAGNVLITFPSLFPGKKIKGKLTDKVVVENKATEGSYPRFESYDKIQFNNHYKVMGFLAPSLLSQTPMLSGERGLGVRSTIYFAFADL